jgi:hypothetical protein
MTTRKKSSVRPIKFIPTEDVLLTAEGIKFLEKMKLRQDILLQQLSVAAPSKTITSLRMCTECGYMYIYTYNITTERQKCPCLTFENIT